MLPRPHRSPLTLVFLLSFIKARLKILKPKAKRGINAVTPHPEHRSAHLAARSGGGWKTSPSESAVIFNEAVQMILQVTKTASPAPSSSEQTPLPQTEESPETLPRMHFGIKHEAPALLPADIKLLQVILGLGVNLIVF